MARTDAVFGVPGAVEKRTTDLPSPMRVTFSMPQARIRSQRLFVQLSSFMMTAFCHSLKAFNQFNERMEIFKK